MNRYPTTTSIQIATWTFPWSRTHYALRSKTTAVGALHFHGLPYSPYPYNIS